jgi:hypothetical protein
VNIAGTGGAPRDYTLRMTKPAGLNRFIPLPEIAGILVATKVNLRCTAIKLKDGGVCLFSPVAGLSAQAKASLAAVGPVTHLLAPNHYHNAGLAEYSSAFPTALLCAAPEAAPRLEALTKLTFRDLADLSAALPAQFSLLAPEGLKTGEVWIRAHDRGLVGWVVVDALAGPKMSGGKTRFDRPELLKTFPRFGVRDRSAYRDWFARQLRADQPRLVVPCHGGIAAADNLPQQLAHLHSETFG